METTELRIGNFVYGVFEDENGRQQQNTCGVMALDSTSSLGDGYWIMVETIDGIEDTEYYEDFKPIPITEEWLKKFGFEYNGGDGYKAPHNTEHWYFTLRNGFMPNSIARGSIKTDNYIGCKYVHQLQNLYFALSNTELILK